MKRILPILLSVVSIAVLFAPMASAKDTAITGWPTSMASTGDSITRAFNSGSTAFTDAPANSWSTGTNASVNSHYTRILAAFPGISGRNYNFAVTGANMIDMNTQMVNVNNQHVDYVTILVGANDACFPTEAEMTTVADFRAQLELAMSTLTTGSPDARIYLMSIPNIYNLWNILHNNGSARFVWGLFGICQSMLANPQSTAQADIDRRNRVNQRVVDFNTQLAEVCAQYIHCRFDNNAVYNTNFAVGDVSTRDYFHPSVSGQATIAAATYAASFDFSDATPPNAWAMSSSQSPVRVRLGASDNAGVSGIEYRIDNGPYIRYTGSSILVFPSSTLSYRAVDVNGNASTWRSISSPPVPLPR